MIFSFFIDQYSYQVEFSDHGSRGYHTEKNSTFSYRRNHLKQKSLDGDFEENFQNEVSKIIWGERSKKNQISSFFRTVNAPMMKPNWIPDFFQNCSQIRKTSIDTWWKSCSYGEKAVSVSG